MRHGVSLKLPPWLRNVVVMGSTGQQPASAFSHFFPDRVTARSMARRSGPPAFVALAIVEATRKILPVLSFEKW